MRLYEAERAAFSGTGLGGKTFESEAEIQRYVDKVVRSKYFRTHCAQLDEWNTVEKIIVQPAKAHQTFSHGGGYLVKHRGRYVDRIQIAPEHRVEWVVLHEISHCAAPIRRRGSGRHDIHGQLFMATFVGLVQRFLGREAAKRLRAECRQRRLKTTKPRAA